MKICVLEHPRLPSVHRFNDIANTPLWSCLMGGYAAAAMEADGFETEFWDHAQPGASFDETLKKLDALSPDLLAVNAVYFWEKTPVLFDFLNRVKEQGFAGHINLFGFFPSLVYQQMLAQYPCIDSVAVGEFEPTLTALARALENKETLTGIQGLALSGMPEPTQAIFRKPSADPDRFAFPKRAFVDRTVTILASRGCYNHCSFCPIPSFYNKGALWRGRSPENIYKEIKALTEKGAKDFYFVDPNFIGPGKRGKQRIIELMKRIRPLNIQFGMETRPQDLDDEVMNHLVASGFNSLLMGVESGSDRVLGTLNKHTGPKTAGDAISLCRKYGIEPEIGFLMFVPDSTLDDLKQNFQFLMDNGLLDRLDRTANLLSHCQIVLSGTSGYQYFDSLNRLEKKGIFEFEADVLFTDPRVDQVSTLTLLACHTILRQMSDKDSPIYWQNPASEIFFKLNQYLVDLFLTLIHSVPDIPDPSYSNTMKKRIVDEINRLLSVETSAV